MQLGRMHRSVDSRSLPWDLAALEKGAAQGKGLAMRW